MKALDSQEAAGARLRDARLAAGYRTAAEAARAINLRPVTVRAHESGQNGLTANMLNLYTRLYGVTPQFLLFGRESDGDRAPVRRPEPEPTAYDEMASELAKTKAKLAYLKDGLRKLLEGLS